MGERLGIAETLGGYFLSLYCKSLSSNLMSTDKRILTDIPLMHSNESSRPKQNTFNIDKVVSISFNRKKKVKSRVKIRGADYAA